MSIDTRSLQTSIATLAVAFLWVGYLVGVRQPKQARQDHDYFRKIRIEQQGMLFMASAVVMFSAVVFPLIHVRPNPSMVRTKMFDYTIAFIALAFLVGGYIAGWRTRIWRDKDKDKVIKSATNASNRRQLFLLLWLVSFSFSVLVFPMIHNARPTEDTNLWLYPFIGTSVFALFLLLNGYFYLTNTIKTCKGNSAQCDEKLQQVESAYKQVESALERCQANNYGLL